MGSQGVVVHAGRSALWPGRGIYVVIEQGRWWIYYMHLSETLLFTGLSVAAGAVIGRVGNTGWVKPNPTVEDPQAGTHTHLGLQDREGIETERSGFFDPEPLFATS